MEANTSNLENIPKLTIIFSVINILTKNCGKKGFKVDSYLMYKSKLINAAFSY